MRVIYFMKRMNPSLNSPTTTTTMTMTKSRRQEVKVSCMTNTALNCGQEEKCEFLFGNILMFFEEKIHFFKINFFCCKNKSCLSSILVRSRGSCVGLIVEGGYMFHMDPDMSSFPVITWHCPKLRWPLSSCIIIDHCFFGQPSSVDMCHVLFPGYHLALSEAVHCPPHDVNCLMSSAVNICPLFAICLMP